ncbi:hypothetical protein AVA65_07755 [Salmonella enterica subsp. enterica serovar Minnesota]|nr:hypothetical protein [Salmonella enterica subsp. enterica serovar Minnesota]
MITGKMITDLDDAHLKELVGRMTVDEIVGLLRNITQPETTTPPNRHPQGNDPFENYLRLQRHELALGGYTDDELANAVYLYGNSTPDIDKVLAGEQKMPIVYLTAGKERIRWLSRQNIHLEQQLTEARALLVKKSSHIQVDDTVTEYGACNGEFKNIILKQLAHTPAKEISLSEPLQTLFKNGGGIPRGSFYIIAAHTPPEKSRLRLTEGKNDTTQNASRRGESQGD